MIILDHWYGIEKLEENYVHQIFNISTAPLLSPESLFVLASSNKLKEL